NYWRTTAFFGGGQAPIEEIELDLHFFGKARGTAAFSFDGPFAVGKTNAARGAKPGRVIPLANSGWQNSEGTPFEIQWTGYSGAWSQIFAYDTEGKRYPTYSQNSSSSPNGGTNRFVVPIAALERIAAITFGEEPRVKRFHNVVVAYPDRSPRTYS